MDRYEDVSLEDADRLIDGRKIEKDFGRQVSIKQGNSMTFQISILKFDHHHNFANFLLINSIHFSLSNLNSFFGFHN